MTVIPTLGKVPMHRTIYRSRTPILAVAASALILASCSTDTESASGEVATRDRAGTLYTVTDTVVTATFDAAGSATAIRSSTLSTRIMGSVMEVLVLEGDQVAAGQPLLRIDARDLAAKESQVAASIAEAEAMHADAVIQAGRIRALYADSAATRAQLDAAETGLARASAGLRAARGAGAELAAVSTYSVIRAPFAGQVTRRFVDPGAFAAPGAPLVTVQDGSRLRITASVTPDVARRLRRGQVVQASVEGVPVPATVEGVVPASAGNLYTVNAIIPNARRNMLPGSTATLSLATGMRTTLVVPMNAVTRAGDLAGVTIRTAQGDEMRWVRLGVASGNVVEVTAGLRAGDRVVIPPQDTLAGRK